MARLPIRIWMLSLSNDEALALVLGAQGFGGARAALPDSRAMRAMGERLGAIQIDSVNVLARSHYLPFFSRFGAYSRAEFERLAYGGKRRAFFEYWAHEASLVAVELHPALRWRMERARRFDGTWNSVAAFGRANESYVERVFDLVRERGASGAGALRDGARGPAGWWSWDDAKIALEFLFWCGRLTTASRRNFERVYDLPERVLPNRILAAATPDEGEAHRMLVLHAVRALGVATERDARDYFRLGIADAKAALASLAESGDVVPAKVEGWRDRAYLPSGGRVRAADGATALISPFDSLVWDRARTERIFGFRYRLEIYTPAHKRVHGYYVLPFLFAGRLAARADLKADRPASTLQVHAVHLEPGADRADVASALREELRRLAHWLDLESCAGAGWRALCGRRVRRRTERPVSVRGGAAD